ncbi:MAG: DUF4405 domain-containing protein [Phycisphaerae bacterium]|nr:DUF4405 domain-containing protein [Phycisphaerae bacterium]
MSETKRKPFSGRGFTSVALGLTFVGLLCSGVVLFITPPGRIAYWTGWRLIGLGKDDWANLHLWFALLAVVLSGFHIWLNWRPLIGYFRSVATRRFALRGDWGLALVLCGVVTAGVVMGVRPFPTLLNWSDRLKNSWAGGRPRGPVAHAELLPLRELAEEAGVDLTVMLERLDDAGLAVESGEAIVRDVAKANNMSPAQLYSIATGTGGRRGGGQGGRNEGGEPGGQDAGGGQGGAGGGQGMGRQTLRQYCASVGVDLEVAIQRLRDANLEASADKSLREIADSGNRHPRDLPAIIKP